MRTSTGPPASILTGDDPFGKGCGRGRGKGCGQRLRTTPAGKACGQGPGNGQGLRARGRGKGFGGLDASVRCGRPPGPGPHGPHRLVRQPVRPMPGVPSWPVWPVWPVWPWGRVAVWPWGRCAPCGRGAVWPVWPCGRGAGVPRVAVGPWGRGAVGPWGRRESANRALRSRHWHSPVRMPCPRCQSATVPGASGRIGALSGCQRPIGNHAGVHWQIQRGGRWHGQTRHALRDAGHLAHRTRTHHPVRIHRPGAPCLLALRVVDSGPKCCFRAEEPAGSPR